MEKQIAIHNHDQAVNQPNRVVTAAKKPQVYQAASDGLLQLQQTIGNQAVQRKMQAQLKTASDRVLLRKATGTSLQRDEKDSKTVGEGSAPIELKRYAIPNFEFTGKEQKITGDTTGGYVDLVYYPSTGQFKCTFQLRWDFMSGMPEEEKKVYKSRFQKTVQQRWSNRYKLIEYHGPDKSAKPTGQKASVEIAFNEPEIRTFTDSMEEINWLLKQPQEVRDSRRMLTTVHVSPNDIRESVSGGSSLNLENHSMETKIRNAKSYANYGTPDPSSDAVTDENLEAYLSGGAYEHYRQAGISITAPRGKSFNQVPAEHEFGHIIGLGDEYIISKKDYLELIRTKGETYARQQLARRRAATGRIMNIGSDVHREHYRPFAAWLSFLTKKHWRVAGD